MKKKQESQEADGESMTITIENEASKELPFDYKALIERVVMGCMDYEKCPYEAEVNVLLTNNEEIHNLIYPFRFNLSQKEAIENVYKSNISVIQGPPGTGKTQTILNIIANLAIMQNKTVAIVSNNNEAVKNVKDKLEKNGYGFFVADLGRNEKRENIIVPEEKK